jgi:transcriptional regulator with XRE-family HTH domain
MSTLTSGADLGQAIRRLRRAHRVTIDDLAAAAGMHPTYLSGIERGLRNPTWSKLCGLADALDVPSPRSPDRPNTRPLLHASHRPHEHA